LGYPQPLFAGSTALTVDNGMAFGDELAAQFGCEVRQPVVLAGDQVAVEIQVGVVPFLLGRIPDGIISLAQRRCLRLDLKYSVLVKYFEDRAT
jgi:hypothetical protein